MNYPLLKAILILPGTALVYVPALILWLTRNTSLASTFPPTSPIIWLMGLFFAATGLVLMWWTMRLFTFEGGGGTPAPWQPIKKFIVLGPYRFVRNPMLLGANLFLIAEAILMQSIPIFVWMVVFVLLNTVYFAMSEEPHLEKRFGQAYQNYKRHVPRWIPRLTPYVDRDDDQSPEDGGL